MRAEERQISNRKRQARLRRRRRRRLLRLYSLALFLCVLTLAVWGIGRRILNFFEGFPTDEISSPVSLADEISAPVSRTDEETLKELERLAKDSRAIRKILDRAEEYPSEMLTALANNPEMTEYVSGYLDRKEIISMPALTDAECLDTYPLFLQWDQRWGYLSYGDSNIGLSGCGPTCLAMAIHELTGDDAVTPASVAEYADSQGYYVEDTGTSWTLMTEGVAAYGLTGRELSLDEGILKRELDAGHPVICAMRAGDFTTAGHFILIYGYTEEGYQVNDPNCMARSERAWSYEELAWQIRNLWAFQITQAK